MSDPKLQPQPGDSQDEQRAAALEGTKSSRELEEATSAGNTPRLSSDDTFLQPGQRLGPYELMNKLGEGGMGAVYKARHTRLNKFVAIKVLPLRLTSDPTALHRFDREMKAVGALEHPNIVRAMDADEHQGTHYLVMEYVEGRDLQQIVKADGPFPVGRAAELVRQAAQALAYAHKHGLVHRDIKPSNMLVTSEGQLKILDLGLARLSQEEADGLTSTGASMGTPDYMAPEQWADTHSADGRSDLYALGCTLFYLLTGRAPFGDDKHKSIVNKMTAHVHEPPPSLTANCPAAPKELDSVYQRLLAKDVGKRLASADELVRLLEPFCDAVPDSKSSAKAPASIADAPATVTFSSNKEAVKAATPAQPRKLSKSMMLAALGAQIVAVLAIWSIFFNRAPQPPGPPVSAKGWQGWPVDAPKPAIAPFTEEEARAYQQAWADYLKVPRDWENSLGMKFVLIPPGEFMMGSTPDEIAQARVLATQETEHWQRCIDSEGPRHAVILTQPFYLGVYEVTQREYRVVTDLKPSCFSGTGNCKDKVVGLDTSNFPVDSPKWFEAADFCIQASERDKLKPFYFRDNNTITPLAGTGYRLPSEAEWEFACRAGTNSRYWSGDTQVHLELAGWHEGNAGGRTHEVGELQSNPFGLFDVHGNVAEWVSDGWSPDYYGKFKDTAAVDPQGPVPAGDKRTTRGGGLGIPVYSRAAARDVVSPDEGGSLRGIRLALPFAAVRELVKRAPTKVSIDYAAERKAAEKILARKGAIIYLAIDGANQWVEAGSALPDKPFAIVEIVMIHLKLQDDDLLRLPPLPSLLKLQLPSNDDLTGRIIPWLSQCPKLTLLDLDNSQINDADIERLVGALPDLEQIRLDGTKVSAAGLKSLNRLKKLTTVSSRVPLEPGLIESLDWLPRVTRLGVDSSWLTTDGGDFWTRIPKLENIYIYWYDGQTTDLERLAKSNHARTLAFQYPKQWTAADWTALQQWESLELLSINYGNISKDTFAQLVHLPRLKELRVNVVASHGLTPADLQPFAAHNPTAIVKLNGQLVPKDGE